MKRSRCRSCGAPILWLRYESTGRLAPIDAEPTVGSIEVDLVAETYRISERHGDGLYTSHFATCPKAAAHRRASARARAR